MAPFDPICDQIDDAKLAAHRYGGLRFFFAFLFRRVEDGELLARRCNLGHARPGKSVKKQAFLASKWPFEISVDRTVGCNPWDKIEDRKKSGLAGIVAERIRRETSEAKIVPAQPPPEHAHIEIWLKDTHPQAFDTKTRVQQEEVDLWEAHLQVCEALAKISRPLDAQRACDPHKISVALCRLFSRK